MIASSIRRKRASAIPRLKYAAAWRPQTVHRGIVRDNRSRSDTRHHSSHIPACVGGQNPSLTSPKHYTSTERPHRYAYRGEVLVIREVSSL